jgi:hypothetical protein
MFPSVDKEKRRNLLGTVPLIAELAKSDGHMISWKCTAQPSVLEQRHLFGHRHGPNSIQQQIQRLLHHCTQFFVCEDGHPSSSEAAVDPLTVVVVLPSVMVLF